MYKQEQDWRIPAYKGFCPTPMDWAQLAAFIDGEGSILINTQKWVVKGRIRKNIGLSLRVMVANTDVRLMVWLKETFGGTYVNSNSQRYYEGKNWKQAYHWGVCSCHAAWLLFNCFPYFHMKGDQAQIGMQLQESLSRYVPGTGELSESVQEERRKLKQQLLVLKAKGINGIPVP